MDLHVNIAYKNMDMDLRCGGIQDRGFIINHERVGAIRVNCFILSQLDLLKPVGLSIYFINS